MKPFAVCILVTRGQLCTFVNYRCCWDGILQASLLCVDGDQQWFAEPRGAACIYSVVRIGDVQDCLARPPMSSSHVCSDTCSLQ